MCDLKDSAEHLQLNRSKPNEKGKTDSLGNTFTPERAHTHQCAIWDPDQINIQQERRSTSVGKHVHTRTCAHTPVCDLKDSAGHIQLNRSKPNEKGKTDSLGNTFTPERVAAHLEERGRDEPLLAVRRE